MMWLVSGALLIAFGSYVALPIGLALYIPQRAALYGIPLDVDRVRVEPFASRVRLSGVRIATAENSSIEWSSVEAQVDLAELLSGRLVLDDFRLSEAKLHSGGLQAGTGDLWPAVVPTALPEQVSVGELVISDVELATVSAALGHPVTIDWLRISSLDEVFRPNGAEVQADASIGEGRSRLQGRLNLAASGWILNVEVDASDVALDGIPALFGADGSWRGSLDGSGPVRLVYSPINRAFSATAGGRWAVDEPELTLPGTAVSGARADWNGTAFMVVSEDSVDTFSADAEIGLHEMVVSVVDVLDVEAGEFMLHINASQAPAPRLTAQGNSPAVRFSGKGDGFEAIDAEAASVDARVALTFADDLGIKIDRLQADALVGELPDGRSIDVEQLEFDRIVADPSAGAVSAATATAERVDWRGFTAPESTGTAIRVAMQGLEQYGEGGFRFALASAKSVEDRSGNSSLRLRDVELDAATLLPTGALAVGGVHVSDTWLAGDTSTLGIVRLSLVGVAQDAGGTTSVASGQADVVDHTLAGRQTVLGSRLDLVGATVSGQAWKAKRIDVDQVDVETGTSSYALQGVTLVDAAGEGAQLRAGLARLGALEHGYGGNRIVVEELNAVAPGWREGTARAQSLDAVSMTLDTVDRNRWQSSGWRLAGVEATASGGAGADTASLDSITIAASDSTAGAQGIELETLRFDGKSGVRAERASAARTHYRTSAGSGVDIIGLRTGALEWNGEALAAKQGTAPLMSVVAATLSASFDTVRFTSARFGDGDLQQLEHLTSAAVRGGGVEPALEWSSSRLELGGYRALGGETMLDFVDTLDIEVARIGDGARHALLRADRLSARGARTHLSGATVLASVEVGGMTLQDADGRIGASARALQASRMTFRGAAMDIGALNLSGLEGTIGLSEQGGWELPALPIGTGDAQSPIRLRIGATRTADSESVLRLIDRTTEPDFETRVDIANAELGGFDSEAIGVPADFSIEASSDTFTAFQAGGVLIPTLTGTDLDLTATIREISLSALSPYARLHLGRDVEGGHADATFGVTVRTSDLAGVADITLSEVVLGDAESPVESSGLGAALTLLEDEQGRIELSVALRGELDAPGFEFDGLLIRALAETAIETAGTSPEDG